MLMQGKRVYATDNMQPGDYCKMDNGDWLLCLPTGIHGTINNTWKIIEHEGGSITVSPSILTTSHNHVYDWHGYLEAGIWRSC